MKVNRWSNNQLFPVFILKKAENTVTIIRGKGQKCKSHKLPYNEEVSVLNVLFSSHSRYAPSKNKSASVSEEYFTGSELYQTVFK